MIISLSEHACKPRCSAFTLIELLAVMVIISLVLGFVLPSVLSVFAGRNLATGAYLIGDTFEQARSFAMGNNTYVFLGVAEYDSAQVTGTAQTFATASKGGRVVVMAVASRGGTSIYDPNTLSASDWSPTSANLEAIMAPRVFDNLHLASYTPSGTASGTTVGTGSMARPAPSFTLGSMPITFLPIFSYPLLSGRYPFGTVFVFDPQGVAHLVGTVAGAASVTDTIPRLIELDFQQTHGDTVPGAPADNPPNYVALQCVGMTGAVKVYK